MSAPFTPSAFAINDIPSASGRRSKTFPPDKSSLLPGVRRCSFTASVTHRKESSDKRLVSGNRSSEMCPSPSTTIHLAESAELFLKTSAVAKASGWYLRSNGRNKALEIQLLLSAKRSTKATVETTLPARCREVNHSRYKPIASIMRHSEMGNSKVTSNLSSKSICVNLSTTSSLINSRATVSAWHDEKN